MNNEIKNILIVSWSYPPINDPRAVKAEAIVEKLLELGFSVTLLTRGELKNFSVRQNKHLDELVLMPLKNWKKFNINLNKSESKFSKDFFLRIINGALLKFLSYPNIQAFYYVFIYLKRLKTKKFDLCISVDGPQQMHWAIAFSRKIKKVKIQNWIADCGDPLTRLTLGNRVAPYFKLVEDFFCKEADVITVPVLAGFNYFKKKFRKKIHLVEHSLIFPEVKSRNNNLKIEGDVPKFAYAGNMMPYKEEIKSFFKNLNNFEQNFEFHIYSGNENFISELLVLNPNLKNKIISHGSLNRFELLKDLIQFDFLVYFQFQGNAQVSFKLIDYSYMNVPVLEFSTPEKDFNKLISFLSGDYSQAMKLDNYNKYSNNVTVPKYLDLLY